MHDMKQKIEDICEMKKQLISFVQSQIGQGLSQVDTGELGEAIDMIKDLTEAEKNFYEGCYYKSVVEAMEDYDENSRMGYTPMKARIPRPNDMNSNRWNSNNRDWDWENDNDISRNTRRMNRDMDDEEDKDEREYGRTFNKFRKARRYYTQTHSEKDRKEMEEHANEHLHKTMMTLQEIWDAADPELRARMKNDLIKFANVMN